MHAWIHRACISGQELRGRDLRRCSRRAGSFARAGCCCFFFFFSSCVPSRLFRAVRPAASSDGPIQQNKSPLSAVRPPRPFSWVGGRHRRRKRWQRSQGSCGWMLGVRPPLGRSIRTESLCLLLAGLRRRRRQTPTSERARGRPFVRLFSWHTDEPLNKGKYGSILGIS